jgi:hypothetical protein
MERDLINMRTQRKNPTVLGWLILIAIVSFNGFNVSCQKAEKIENEKETKEETLPSPPKFEGHEYWRRTGQAFFSKNAKEELRILRNEMFARHGRKFDSKDMQEYFGKTSWYRINPDYHDSLLSPAEMEFVNEVLKAENLIDTMPKGLMDDYEKEVSFRSQKSVDTIIISLRDYTGDGKNDTQYTRIYKDKQEIVASNTIVDNGDTIFVKIDTVSFAPKFSEYSELTTDYETAIKFAPPDIERKARENWPAYIYSLMAKDIAAETGKDTSEFMEEMKDYVKKFEGTLFNTTTSEASGCAYIWYSPIKKFVTFYRQ